MNPRAEWMSRFPWFCGSVAPWLLSVENAPRRQGDVQAVFELA